LSGTNPPVIDNILPGDLPPEQPPGEVDNTLPESLADRLRGKLRTPLEYLQLFYPKYFSPDPIDPDIVDAMLDVARMARPQCLSFRLQNVAQAFYAAYLLEEQIKNTSPEDGGTGDTITSGIILSESEGDVSVTYADPRSSSSTTTGETSAQAPKGAWDKWYNLSKLCKYGAITTRFGQRY
jgi:hypothetical protein